jgi:hypothetical protein
VNIDKKKSSGYNPFAAITGPDPAASEAGTPLSAALPKGAGQEKQLLCSSLSSR